MKLKWPYIAVGLSAAAAMALDAASDLEVTIRADDFIVFAIFYILAQATERLVEPLMGAVAPPAETQKAAVGTAKAGVIAAATSGDPASKQAAAQTQADAQTALTETQKGRAIIGWALASSFALLVCGLLGLGIIGAVSETQAGSDFWASVFQRVDVVVTGLAVGAGTKPLHDLISRIEKSKENADPATAPVVPPAV